MDQIKELQEQIEALKKTVNELQSGTVRVETNTAKLARMKDQIVKEVFPEKKCFISILPMVKFRNLISQSEGVFRQ